MADVALGAIELVVGIIRTEVQQHGEMQEQARFVADEMESMTSHLRYLVSLGVGIQNHQARTWTKQVMEFAIDSKECVDQFTQSRSNSDEGIVGRVKEMAGFVDRRQLAGRMKNLKARASDIAERLQKYAVTAQAQNGVPEDPDFYPNNMPDDDFRRKILFGPYMVEEGTEELMGWLKKEPGIEERGQWPRVIGITDGANGDVLAEQVYNRSSEERMFHLKAHVTIQRPPHYNQVLQEMLRQLLGMDTDPTGVLDNLSSYSQGTWLQGVLDYLPSFLKFKRQGVLDNLPPYLKDRKVLVVFSGLDYPELWTHVKMALGKFKCSPGSAVVFSTKVRKVAQQCSAKEFSLVGLHLKTAASMPHTIRTNNILGHLEIVEEILERCNPNNDSANMFLRALCSNPNWTEKYLKSLLDILQKKDPDNPNEREEEDRMITFSYQGLPKDYKICLWYSTFCIPRSYQVRRASLVRRWRAEGLINAAGQSPENELAEQCFHTFITHKLFSPCKFGPTGKIKSCVVHPSAVAVITKKIPTLEDLVLTNQLPIDSGNMLFSLRNAFQLHQSSSTVNLQNESMPNSTRPKKTMDFLRYLGVFPTSRLVSVLDIEDYKDLKKKHLNSICSIHKLKYLSLRNTGVDMLPYEIHKLVLLETLDIRQTRVRVLNAFLPKLRHLLAGCTDHPSTDTNVKSNESFSTVSIPEPAHVRKMHELEVLSHVTVSNSAKELVSVGEKLKKLRKLGVVFSGRKAELEDLFIMFHKYSNKELRSLSIRMEQPGDWDVVDGNSWTLSPCLESLNICSVRGGLPHQIKELHKLAKITLRDTLLKENALDILGNLTGLRCLKLRYHSFAESTLMFRNGQFSSLMELVLEDNIITGIAFSPETAPNLVKVIWSFARMQFLSGVQTLRDLRHVEFHGGTCDSIGLEELRGEIVTQGERIRFIPEPPASGQGSGQLDVVH